MDFGVYWRVANTPISLVYQHRASLNFPYPPTMLMWIAPLNLMPRWLAYEVWVGVSILALVGAAHRYLDRPALLLALIAPPVLYCLLAGQVSLALGALILWACATDNRTAAGIALGIAASIKPQLVIMAPLMLAANGDYRALLSAAITVGSLIFLSVFLYGLDIWTAWLGMLEHFQGVVIRNGVLNVSITPASVASLWHLPPIPFLLAGAAIGAWLVVMCRDRDPLTRSAAVIAGSLLASPYGVIYDLAAAAPFLAWSVVRGRIAAVVAYVGGLNIIPLVIISFELIQAARKDTGCAPQEATISTS